MMKKNKIKIDVDINKIPEELRPFIKNEMSYDEISMFGTYLIKRKIDDIKNYFKKILFKKEKT